MAMQHQSWFLSFLLSRVVLQCFQRCHVFLFLLQQSICSFPLHILDVPPQGSSVDVTSEWETVIKLLFWCLILEFSRKDESTWPRISLTKVGYTVQFALQTVLLFDMQLRKRRSLFCTENQTGVSCLKWILRSLSGRYDRPWRKQSLA